MSAAPAARPAVRIERNAFGDPVRVHIGTLEVTHLVARVQSNTTMGGTAIEVVLSVHNPRAPATETRQ